MIHNNKNKQGYVLIITVAFMLIFTMLGMAAIHVSGANNELSDKRRMSDAAFWLAEAGIEKARNKIQTNSCTEFVQCGTTVNCASCSCGGVPKCLLETISSAGNSAGDYSAMVNSGNSVITSTGGFPGLSTGAYKRKIAASSSPFAYALFGNDNVTLGNNDVVNGNVGTNGDASDISTGNNTNVNGEVLPEENLNLSLIGVPAGFSAANPGPTQTGAAPAAISSSGDYRYDSVSGSLTVTGNVRLHLTNTSASINLGNNKAIILTAGSSLTVYAEGGMNANANNIDLNNANNPKASNFLFYSTGSSPITIKNNSNVYMAVYAPNADIDVSKNNGDTFGSFIGKTVFVKNNNTIHYDPDLVNYGGGAGNFVIRVWAELDPNT